MSFVKFFKSLILFMLLFFASWQETQAIMATAYVDTAIVVLGDTFTLSIDVIGESQYRMPNLTVPGCSIVAKRSMSKIVSQNGRVVSTRIYSYEIQPHKAGTITVPSVRIEYKGEYSDTQPINVEVIDNSSQKKKSSKKKPCAQPPVL